MNSQEIRALMDAALEGEISEADFVRLEAALSVDESARQEYYDRVVLSTLLESEAQANQSTVNPPARVRLGNSRIDRWRWAFLAMTVVCAGLVVFVAFQNQTFLGNSRQAVENNGAEQPQEAQSSGFAIIAGLSDVVWQHDGDDSSHRSLVQGSIVPPGELHLKQGVAQFELFSGVTLVVEGDARISILSPMEVQVLSGKVSARVPEAAQGFQVITSAGRVVDLGTEFAVSVTDEQSEVHVLDGEVEWHANGQPIERLLEGHGARAKKNGEFTSIASDGNGFVGANELRQRIESHQRSRIEAWALASDALANDERLLFHYRLSSDQTKRRRVVNRVGLSGGSTSEGAIVAARATSNRWGQSDSALDFSPAGSRIRLHVPGTHEHLSLVCWVKINSLDRWYNSLFLTDGHDQGEPHWQIMDDGRLFFSVKKRDQWDAAAGEKDKHVFYSPPFWDQSLSGRWIMLATVYDGDRRVVTHYLDGEVLSAEPIPDDYLVDRIRIGDASIGNWGLPERDQPRFAIRNLNGSLDQFLVFSRALTNDEIDELYDVGKP